jgi:hypothetical protein
MCDKTMKKWYIIDYGAIWKNGYKKNIDDDRMGYTSDIVNMTWIFVENPVFDYLEKNKVREPLLPPYSKCLKTITSDPRIKIIRSYLPKKRDKNQDTEALICCLLFYDLYIKAIDADKLPISKKYINFLPPNAKYYLHAIKNS